MKEFWTTIQVVFAGIGGWLGWFLGGCDGLLYALLAFAVIDYITGIMCAVVDKKLSSEVGFKGIFKKVLIFALVGIGHILDTRVIGSGSVMRTAVIFFYLSNEGVSLLENAAYLGLPIPQKLKSVLEQLHDRAEIARWCPTPNSARTPPGSAPTALTASRPTAWWVSAVWKRWATSFCRPHGRQAATMASAWTVGSGCMWKRKTAPGAAPARQTTIRR